MGYGQAIENGTNKVREFWSGGKHSGQMTTSRYDQIMKTFGRRLRKARVGGGYRSAQSFSAVLGIEPHTYRKYERGQSEPNFEIFVRICELLQVDANTLLPIDAPRKRSPGNQSAAA